MTQEPQKTAVESQEPRNGATGQSVHVAVLRALESLPVSHTAAVTCPCWSCRRRWTVPLDGWKV